MNHDTKLLKYIMIGIYFIIFGAFIHFMGEKGVMYAVSLIFTAKIIYSLLTAGIKETINIHKFNAIIIIILLGYIQFGFFKMFLLGMITTIGAYVIAKFAPKKELRI